MKLEEDKLKVLEALEKALENDRIKNNIVHFTDLGLIEMTRKRVGNPLSNDFLEPCSECSGLGHVKSRGTILTNIFNELKQSSEEKDVNRINLYLSPDMHEFIMDNYIEFIQSFIKGKNKKINFFKEETRKNRDYELILEI